MFNSDLSSRDEKNKAENINSDFIVHNMPKADRFAGQTFISPSLNNPKRNLENKEQALSDHHKVGIFIISAALILIMILIYLAYIFMIKPAANTAEGPVIQNNVQNQESIEEPVAEPSIILPATTTNNILAAPTSSPETIASSTSEALPEEKDVAPIFSIVSTIDTDLDGLTDDEERMIGTNAALADSDADSFLDISELKNGYNPLMAGRKMDDKSPFNRYKIDNKADILFLNSWTPAYSEASKTIVFTDEDKAFIQVIFQDNEDMSLPSDWYEQQFPGIAPGEAISGEGWSGFYSQDSAAAYIFSNDLSKIYTISYSPLIENDLSLPLFRLMVKTLLIK